MIHIIQQLTNPFGGSEHRAINLFKVLGRHTDVRLWSEFEPSTAFTDAVPVHLIRPKRLAYPKTGTFFFCGACWYVGPWLEFTKPNRIIVLHNYRHDSYQDWLKRARSPWQPKIEWVFASEQMREGTGLDGPVMQSPIDLSRFHPLEENRSGRPFTVGRLSRDVPEKFHEEDCRLFASLAQAGIKVRIMGGLHLKANLPEHPLIELLATGAEPPEVFLRSLDSFLYRTHSEWFEPSGRVVHEAMACGLPAICGANGGYSEVIQQGRNGFLFDSNAQALETVLRLRADKQLHQHVSSAARATAEALYGEGLPREEIEFYLR